jgi:hypothetical protein
MVKLPIGTCGGSFTIEHNMTINSLPSDAISTSVKDTSGFFIRFINTSANKTGGGWCITRSGNQAQLTWKSTYTTDIPNVKLDVGKTYTFKYEFREVGTGEGAMVRLIISDEDGNILTGANGVDLSLRNFTYMNEGKTEPINAIQIYNQAVSGSASSITFDNARLYTSAEVSNINGSDITYRIDGSIPNVKMTAVKYDAGGALDQIEMFDLTDAGEDTVSAPFAPDKVFLWSSMLPLCGVKTPSDSEE